MAQELLVDERIEDGGRLATELVRNGLDVAAAFWIHTQEDELWYLYLATSAVVQGSFADAFRNVYTTMSHLQIQSISLSQIKLVEPSNPIASDVIALRGRRPARISIRLGAGRLGKVAIDEAYVYPQVDRALTRTEVLQAITALMNRTGAISPSSVTLRDGSTFMAVPVGIQLSQPGPAIMVTLHEHATGRIRVVSADDIAAIQ